MKQASPKISVVLPCYQMEEYLSDIMSDLRSQSFQDIEILLVNDGGGNRQLELMQQLKGNDDKVSIINKPNGGLCSARNAGLKIAKGEYIVFIDPDDRLESFYLQRLFEAITSEDTDIAAGGFTFYYTREKRKINDFLQCSDLRADGNKRVEYLLSIPTARNAVWNKIYKAQFISSHQLFFDENLFYGEDETFNMQCLLYTHRITLIPDCGYIYMCRDTNSMCSKYVKSYREARLHALSLRMKVMRKIELPEENIQKLLQDEYYLLGYFMLCNIFKKHTPLSLKKKRKYIDTYILHNSQIAEAVKTRDYRSDNFFTKIYTWCFKMKSATCMAVIFGLLYQLKYRFMWLYIFLAPILKR